MLDGSISGNQPELVQPADDILAVFAKPTPVVEEGSQDGQNSNQNPFDEVQIDPKFSNLDHSIAVLRTLQGAKDKLANELNHYKQQVNELQTVQEFFLNIEKDPDLRKAFIAQYEPDLINTQDIESKIAKELAKEFGEDFEPDPDEARKRGTKSWKYNKKFDEKYEKYSSVGGSEKIADLKTFSEKKKLQMAEEQKKSEAQVKSFQQKKNIDDITLKEFVDFNSRLNIEHLWAFFEHYRGVRGSVAPVNMPIGAPVQRQAKNNIDAYVDSIFGPKGGSR